MKNGAIAFVAIALAAVFLLRAADLVIAFPGAAAQTTTEPSRQDGAQPSEQTGLRHISDVEANLAEAIEAREASLSEREEALSTREALVAAAEAKLRSEFDALARQQASLDAREAEQEDSRRGEYETLSSAYERMKARDAARIFDALDEAILLPVAQGMRTQALAGVLAEMQPEKARRLTAMLAESPSGDHVTRGGAGE